MPTNGAWVSPAHTRDFRYSRIGVARGPYRKRDPRDYLWPKIQKGSPDECWPWLGRINSHGYGMFDIQRRTTTAHRATYLLLVGEIPPGYDVDHICHTRDCEGGQGCPHRRCVNPRHLQLLTRSENLKRGHAGRHTTGEFGGPQWQRAKTRCPRGHPYDAENTYVLPSRPTARYCRQCHLEHTRERRARARALTTKSDPSAQTRTPLGKQS